MNSPVLDFFLETQESKTCGISTHINSVVKKSSSLPVFLGALTQTLHVFASQVGLTESSTTLVQPEAVDPGSTADSQVSLMSSMTTC